MKCVMFMHAGMGVHCLTMTDSWVDAMRMEVCSARHGVLMLHVVDLDGMGYNNYGMIQGW